MMMWSGYKLFPLCTVELVRIMELCKITILCRPSVRPSTAFILRRLLFNSCANLIPLPPSLLRHLHIVRSSIYSFASNSQSSTSILRLIIIPRLEWEQEDMKGNLRDYTTINNDQTEKTTTKANESIDYVHKSIHTFQTRNK